jgi:proline iminopeptidase
VEERPFEIEVEDGVLVGHAGGKGAMALLLHGGPGMPDYTAGCAAEIHDLFACFRYTQRGTAPSTVGGPYTIETHMSDALALMDAVGLEKAWAVGHSWGGHLALHLAVAHPERLYGVVCINTLGASSEIFPDFHANLKRDLTDEELARVEEIDEHYDEGTATEEELVENVTILWPHYFANPAAAPKCPITARGVECSIETNKSIKEHFEQGTLANGLFVHGLKDPLPVRASVDTAKLIPGAVVAKIPNCGHFPWLEQPGELRRALGRLFAKL